MSQLFNKIKVASTSRSTFDLSHHQVTTSDFGYLIPICYRDMVPNDDFVVNPKVFCRLSPLAVPTYGKITCRIHHFFVPYRILYPYWDSFLVQDSSNHTVPPYFLVGNLRTFLNYDKQINPSSGTLPRGTYARLMSNLGLNPEILMNSIGLSSNERIAAFPFLAYYRIWMDYFMDSNVYDHPTMVEAFNEAIESGGSLSVGQDFLQTKSVCFKKDYFTTAKTSPQDGSASKVAVDVAGIDLNPSFSTSSQSNVKLNPDGTVQVAANVTHTSVLGQFTVEALRAANALQRYAERNNFVGSKIINRIFAHFGVEPTPERLDMAEFIGGSSFPVQIGDVTSTSFEQGEGVYYGLGAQAGKGVAAGQHSVKYHAKEHGVFMSLLSILPDTGYYQGLSRFWSKGVYGDALDYFTPEFENLGFQAVLNKEVYCPSPSEAYQNFDSDGVFGYTPRFSEYKFSQDVLGGDFIFNLDDGGETPTGTLMDSFHLFRKLSYDDENPLALNSNFVECKNRSSDYDRIFQISSNEFDHFYFNVDMDIKATRPMSGFGEPSLDSTNNAGDGNTMNLPYGGTRL